MRKALLISLIMLACSFAAIAQDTPPDQPKRGPSTPEERQRFIALTHKLEATPLDTSLYADKKWAKQWINDIPDISVTACPVILGDVMRYKYAADLLYQVVFGNVVFLIEHPDKKNDKVAQYTAGIESALKAYKGMVRADPVHVSQQMEDLLEKQREGKLADFVGQTVKDCQSGDQVGL